MFWLEIISGFLKDAFDAKKNPLLPQAMAHAMSANPGFSDDDLPMNIDLAETSPDKQTPAPQ